MQDRHGGEQPLDPASPYYPKQELMTLEPHGLAATMCRTDRWKYVLRMDEADELYDLRDDPNETRNLSQEPDYGDVLARMRRRMLQWYQQTGSVLPS
mgnify:CR=1 FL=1